MQLSPEQFHTLFDRAAQPVLLVQDGVITQCSSRAEGLIAPGSPIRELLPPDAVLQELIAAAPGCKLTDDLASKVYPMPLDTSNQDLVYVGRIRDDLTDERGLNLWCCGDQLRKGAATNAVQIAEIVAGL